MTNQSHKSKEKKCSHGYQYGECPDDIDGICVEMTDWDTCQPPEKERICKVCGNKLNPINKKDYCQNSHCEFRLEKEKRSAYCYLGYDGKCIVKNCKCHKEKCTECQFEESHSQACSKYKEKAFMGGYAVKTSTRPFPSPKLGQEWKVDFLKSKLAQRLTPSTRQWIMLYISDLLSKTKREVFEEERQFILNILDGIDKADEELGNTMGGTKAIRFALKSRIY